MVLRSRPTSALHFILSRHNVNEGEKAVGYGRLKGNIVGSANVICEEADIRTECISSHEEDAVKVVH